MNRIIILFALFCVCSTGFLYAVNPVETRILGLLDETVSLGISSESKVQITAYDLTLIPLKDKLIEIYGAGKGVSIEIVVDYDNAESGVVQELKSAGISVVNDSPTGSSLMHNKFMLISSDMNNGGEKKLTVITGSMNYTARGVNYNNNNTIIFSGSKSNGGLKMLFDNFETEFIEMYKDSKFSTQKTGNLPPHPLINPIDLDSGIKTEVYFIPETTSNIVVNESFPSIAVRFSPQGNWGNVSDYLVNKISQANSRIRVAAFTFTDSSIAKALKDAVKRGVLVDCIMEENQYSAISSMKSAYQDMKRSGVDVILDENNYNFHNKYFIIDNTTIITGSHNPTASANEINDENIVSLSGEVQIVNSYIKEFDRLRIDEYLSKPSVRGMAVLSPEGTFLSGVKFTVDSVKTIGDEDGWYSFSGISAGTYDVYAQLNGYYTTKTTFSIPNVIGSNGQNIPRADTILERIINYTSVTGQLKDPSGNVLEGIEAKIIVNHKGIDTIISAKTDSSGYYRIDRVPLNALSISFSGQSIITNTVNFGSPLVSGTIKNMGLITLQNRYAVTGYYNPVVEDWIVVSIKDLNNSGEPQSVTLTQNNHVPVNIQVQRLGSDNSIYSGTAKILRQYSGEAIISVNNGEGTGKFIVRTLSPRDGTIIKISGKQGVLAVEPESVSSEILAGCFIDYPPVTMNGQIYSEIYDFGPKNIELQKPARLQIRVSGKSGKEGSIYRHNPEKDSWEWVSSRWYHEDNETIYEADIKTFDRYAVIKDTEIPEMVFEEQSDSRVELSVNDNLSGINPDSLSAFLNGKKLDLNFSKIEGKVFVYLSSDKNLSSGELKVQVEDNSGNSAILNKSVIVSSAPLNLYDFKVYPNPVTDSGGTIKFSYGVTKDSMISINIYDYSGNLVKALISDERKANMPYEELWDLTNNALTSVHNGVYFYRIKFSDGSESKTVRGKIAVLR